MAGIEASTMTSLGTWRLVMPLSELTMARAGPLAKSGLDIGLDLGLLVGGKVLDLGDQIAEAVVKVDAKFAEYTSACLAREVLEEDPHSVAEDDRIGNLHHRGLHVQGEEHPSLLGFGDLLFKERERAFLLMTVASRTSPALRAVFSLSTVTLPSAATNSIFTVGGLGHGDGLLVGEEIVLGPWWPRRSSNRRTTRPSNAGCFGRIP